MEKKIDLIEFTIEDLPIKVNECVSLCKNVDYTIQSIKKT